MAKGKRDGLLIVGGGLAGSLAALAMVKLRPEVPILLIEESASFGGNHSWSFLDNEVDEAHRWLLDPLVSQTWPGFYVAFPGLSRKTKLPYSRITSADLDTLVRKSLRPDQYRLNTKAVAVRENEVVLPDGEVIKADAAIDARGATRLSRLDLGWRKFVGREYTFPTPHRVDLPVLMDATVEQIDGFRFFYLVPLSENRLLVEDSCFSNKPDLDAKAVGDRIEAYCKRRGWKGGEYKSEEAGVLPLALSDDVQAFWRGGGAQVAKIGLRGGFFHPSTGYSLADAVRSAILLSEQKDVSGALLRELFEAEAERLWRKREFYRTFNAAMFDTPVWGRRDRMAALYGLEPEVIARFHAARLRVLDRMRIAGAKPPKARG